MTLGGKLVGGLLGALLGGPPLALVGVGIGHQMDRQLAAGARAWLREPDASERERRERALLLAQFSLAGALAQAGERLPSARSAAFEALCGRVGVTGSRRDLPARVFADGLRADFPLIAVINAFRRDCQWRVDLTARLLDALVYFIGFDAEPTAAQRQLLAAIANALGVSEAMLTRYQREARGSGGATSTTGGRQLDPVVARAVLEVPPHASAEEIRRAYRRETSRHHPDRLIAIGATAAELAAAAERTDLIRKAYETLREGAL